MMIDELAWGLGHGASAFVKTSADKVGHGEEYRVHGTELNCDNADFLPGRQADFELSVACPNKFIQAGGLMRHAESMASNCEFRLLLQHKTE